MLEISSFTVNGESKPLLLDDPHPIFGFSLDNGGEGGEFKSATITLDNGARIHTDKLSYIRYEGKPLEPYHDYTATLEVNLSNGSAKASTSFRMGKMDKPWIGQWISDPTYQFTGKGNSPEVLSFKKDIKTEKPIKEAYAYLTAMGVYRFELNGRKVGDRYLAPGFTSYEHHLQYQGYDVTKSLKEGANSILVHVAGGWAVGSFVFSRKNRWYADRQALLFELHIEYEDGSKEIIDSDDSWLVSREGPYTMSDLYDGESYDANKEDIKEDSFHKAGLEKLRNNPNIYAEIGCPIRKWREFKPEFLYEKDGELIFDCHQNFAGIASIHIKDAKKGDVVVIKHAEVLTDEGGLNTALLRSAKATLTYTCKDGEQSYEPEFTYMGFRYLSVKGLELDAFELTTYALTSEIEEIGEFECSDPLLNRLDLNIRYSARSNFLDIPTDCPQRDERMGWSGDIAIFAETACYDYKMSNFLRKWLKDMRAEQNKGGGFPCTTPIHGYGFPATMPRIAIDFWGDAILEVPYAIYRHEGDLTVLKENYEAMKKYVKACLFWAKIWGVGKYRYIWHTPAFLHFGDWVSPDVDKMSTWQKRSKYTATASLCHCLSLLSEISSLLGEENDSHEYKRLSRKVADAYVSVFLNKDGKLKKEAFQTGYVLPLSFDMIEEKKKRQGSLDALVKLIEDNSYCIGTGFPGTPRILECLSKGGRSDVAYKMLLNKKAPSWLYAVEVGATTILEKFDGLLEDGTARKSEDGTGEMISFNHYASGSVGRFLYERIAGMWIEEAGFRKIRFAPTLGGGLSYCRMKTHSPFGQVSSYWHIDGNKFTYELEIPIGSLAGVDMPDGSHRELKPGKYVLECAI